MVGTDRDRRMFFAGYQAALERYAVWKDGERLVGVRRRPLPQVLSEMRSDQHVLIDLSIALNTKENDTDG